MYPIDKSIMYLTRVFKAIRLMTLLNSNYYTLNLPRLLQQYKIVSYIRKPIWKLRQRISLPCLRLLTTRLEEIDPIETLQKYERLSKFTFEGVSPGWQAIKNTYSFYPIIFNEPNKAISAMWNRGYQVLTGHEVHCLAKTDDENINENLTPEAKSIINSIILLPITLETPTKDIEKLQKEISEFVNALNRGLVLSMKQLIAKI